jgi:hypothetical protein
VEAYIQPWCVRRYGRYEKKKDNSLFNSLVSSCVDCSSSPTSCLVYGSW